MTTLAQPATISLKNILLATDLSPSSEMALQYARTFAREPGVRVHTLHVSGPDHYQLLNPEAFAATFGRRRENPRHDLDALKGLLDGRPREVPVRGHRVWEVIDDVAARYAIDLLILGTHARTGLPKLLLGSVAEEVFRDLAIPVLTVGCDVKPPSSSHLAVERVLLAADCRPFSRAPAYAAQLCEWFGAELIVVHVAGKDEPSLPGSPARASRDGVVADGVVAPGTTSRQVREALAGIAPHMMKLVRRPVFLVEYGDPAARVLHAAMELNADLVILGAHHPYDVRTGARFARRGGSTAARIIAGAPCPVLTLRDREPEAAIRELRQHKAS